VPREGAESDDTRFVKQAYFIEPDKIGRKAFYLLRQVLEERGLSAICKVVIKDREALGAIDPFANTMLLTTLHWPDEVRSTKELDLPDDVPEFKPAEMKMAEQLVAAMTGDFDATQYKDEYREALMEVIEAKVEGRETVAQPEPEETNLVDLMAALQASVEQAKKARAASGGEPVSVEEAKRKREARGGKAAEKKSAATAKRAGKAARSDEAREAEAADEAEERPARRRKSA